MRIAKRNKEGDEAQSERGCAITHHVSITPSGRGWRKEGTSLLLDSSPLLMLLLIQRVFQRFFLTFFHLDNLFDHLQNIKKVLQLKITKYKIK